VLDIKKIQLTQKLAWAWGEWGGPGYWIGTRKFLPLCTVEPNGSAHIEYI
jgi:hypothetical protein